MPKERPDEEVVRSQLRDEKQRVEEESTVDCRRSTEDEAAPDSNGSASTDAEAKAAEYLGRARRPRADCENSRRGAVKDMAAWGAGGRAGLIRELLPVVDNL